MLFRWILWKWKRVRLMTFKVRELRGKGNSEKAKRRECVWKICNEKCIFCHALLTIKTICSVHWSKRRKAVNSAVCGYGNVWNQSELLRRQEVINGDADDEAVFVFVTWEKIGSKVDESLLNIHHSPVCRPVRIVYIPDADTFQINNEKLDKRNKFQHSNCAYASACCTPYRPTGHQLII